MSENNLPKVEIKADLTKVAEEAYNDTIHPIASSTKAGLGFCMNFLTSGIKPYMYRKIKESEHRLKEIDAELTKKYNKIPDENKTYPRTNILGPAIDVLKYNLEEEHIRKMFTDILISEMDNRKQNKVLPSYTEIVRQLSKEDAELLKFIKDNNLHKEPIMKIKYKYADGGFMYSSNNIVLVFDNSYDILTSVVLDNLQRLKLVDITFNTYKHDEKIYESAFKQIKCREEFNPLPPNVSLDYSKGLIQVTDFGKNFIDICLS